MTVFSLRITRISNLNRKFPVSFPEPMHRRAYHLYLPTLLVPSFTTIDPQRAIGYLQIPCACSRFGPEIQSRCKPNYGSCVDGRRSVPIELLDVAGLVPGAHEGRGLGNRFLDDLRHADALVHVVDVSGSTDAEGETHFYTEDVCGRRWASWGFG